LLELIARHIPNPSKQTTSARELLGLARAGAVVDTQELTRILQSPAYNLTVGGKRYRAAEIESACRTLNPTLYLFRAECFYTGVSMLTNFNAQGEYYLTDVVKHYAAIQYPDGTRRYRVRAVVADNADWIQGFNTPEELEAIRRYARARSGTA
jgi:bifunctional N-acetylglucosamine-1-phosphate-uridyltransferase/glucosamine-1-phosphate-acetyltransferase GlmU-like protein